MPKVEEPVVEQRPEDADEEVCKGGRVCAMGLAKREAAGCSSCACACQWRQQGHYCRSLAGSGSGAVASGLRVGPLARACFPLAQLQQELLASVAPKKANWDLKREVQPKLDKLERRTLRALVDIMQQEERRRLEEEGGVAD